jgi:UDP-glucose 4-epimerase/UDP-glucuronate decarboxylase
MAIKKTILVTGGAGFIAYHLTKALLEQTSHEVIALDSLVRGKRDAYIAGLEQKYPARYSCITKPLQTALPKLQADVVFHLAAINGTRYFYEMPYTLLRNNILATLDLLDFYKDKEVKILYSSSSEVYGDLDPIVPTPETTAVGFKDVFNARWSYGSSKLIGEFALINAARTNPKMEYVIFRLHNIYGPRMGYEHVIPGFFKRMLDGEDPMVIKNPTDTRAFCYVSDACNAMIKLMDCEEANGQIVHVGNPVETSVWDLAQKAAELFYDSKKLQKGQKVDMGSTSRRCPDISKLIKLTGFKPKVSLAEGLKLTYEFYKADYKK